VQSKQIKPEILSSLGYYVSKQLKLYPTNFLQKRGNDQIASDYNINISRNL